MVSHAPSNHKQDCQIPLNLTVPFDSRFLWLFVWCGKRHIFVFDAIWKLRFIEGRKMEKSNDEKKEMRKSGQKWKNNRIIWWLFRFHTILESSQALILICSTTKSLFTMSTMNGLDSAPNFHSFIFRPKKTLNKFESCRNASSSLKRAQSKRKEDKRRKLWAHVKH